MTLLRNCRVVDVRRGLVKETSVAIESSKIVSLGDPKNSDNHSIDLEGAYLLPGLVNCHVHLGIVFPFNEFDPRESPAVTALRCLRRGMDALQAGVTTVRTVGTAYGADLFLRSMIQKGWVKGPRIVSAGSSISVTGGHGDNLGALLADGPDEFRKKAREELVSGANHLKIYITGGISHREETFDEPQMSVGEMKAVVSMARSENTYVTAHAGESGPILKAVEAEVRCFEHGYLLDREAARAVRENGGYLCPTLVVTRSPNWMRVNRFEEWTIQKALEAGNDHLESIRTAIRESVKILNGTDIPPGDEDEGVNITVKEMEHYVDAGLSPLEAIQTSSLNGAELMGIGKQIGVVEPGYQADLIATPENPLKDIRALRGIFFVMQSGRVIRWDHA
jgi:imidazolonepropionase-like amidohydrolase